MKNKKNNTHDDRLASIIVMCPPRVSTTVGLNSSLVELKKIVYLHQSVNYSRNSHKYLIRKGKPFWELISNTQELSRIVRWVKYIVLQCYSCH